MKIAFIGAGKMASAIGRGLMNSAGVKWEAAACDPLPKARENFTKVTSIPCYESMAEALRGADVVLLAVKPQFIRAVGADIKSAINPDTLILSIVAGYTLQMLHDLLESPGASIVRVMPNTPAMVGEGVLAACRGQHVKEEQWQFSKSLLQCMGLMEEVPESLMDAVTGLSGSSPAFVFLFMEALSDAGVRAGLPRKTAQRFAAQVLLGCGKLALETGLHPGQLKDMVPSPAGTTIEGVAALEKHGFRFAVMDAVGAAVERSKSLGK